MPEPPAKLMNRSERSDRRLNWILAVWIAFEVILFVAFLIVGIYHALEWLLN